MSGPSLMWLGRREGGGANCSRVYLVAVSPVVPVGSSKCSSSPKKLIYCLTARHWMEIVPLSRYTNAFPKSTRAPRAYCRVCLWCNSMEPTTVWLLVGGR